MHQSNLLMHTVDAEMQALLELHAAQSLKTFLAAARRTFHAVVPRAAIWFAPALDSLLQCLDFRADKPFKSASDFRRFLELHPIAAFLRANPDKPLATFSDVLTDASLMKSRFYREFMARRCERYSVVLAFRQGASLKGLIGLSQSKSDGDFSSAELKTLGILHGHLGSVLRRVCELQSERNTHESLELLLNMLTQPAVVLDWDLKIVYHNGAADRLAALWQPPGQDAEPGREVRSLVIPQVVRELCDELKTTWNQPFTQRRRVVKNGDFTVMDPSLPGFRVSVRCVQPNQMAIGMPRLAIAFEDLQGSAVHSPSGAESLPHVSRLSLREREVASLVCEGESNKEIAADLGKSVLTVKAQLQSIYQKLGVPGRGRLMQLLRHPADFRTNGACEVAGDSSQGKKSTRRRIGEAV